jgi:phosphate-selective porin OprO and OprP
MLATLEGRSRVGILVLCGLVVVSGREVRAQGGSPPPPASTTTAPAPPAPSVEQLAERLRKMEEANRKLAEQLERDERRHNEEMRVLLERYGELSNRLSERERGAEPVGESFGTVPRPPDGRTRRAYDREAAAVETPHPDYRDGSETPAPPGGFYPPTWSSFETDDDEYQLQVNVESQIEARAWAQGNQDPAHSGFFLPRQRFFFRGKITRPIEYELSFNRGLNNINLLNAYFNLHLDDRFQIRFGRYFTPMNYDQYAISNYWMPTPERSVFTTNVGLGRQIGLMAWGYLLDNRLDYAVGLFNGSRNSFESLNNAKDVVGFLNARPFELSESLSFLEFLNVGASVAYGNQDQPPAPASFRVGAGSPDTNIPGTATTPFLILNPGVIERGQRLLGSVHAAYFFRGLSLIGEWQYGYNGYATPGRPSAVSVPLSGFYVTGAYFLTGEDVERRSRVRPLRPLFPTRKDQPRGLGAWEAVARVSELRLGESIFTGGFADPDLWSRSATTTEVGLNWYWNEYFKMYIFWLHADFGEPVQYRVGGFQRGADMFWLRCQLYF